MHLYAIIFKKSKTMDSHKVKRSVIESYGKLAKRSNSGILSKLFACCDPSESAALVGKAIGYSSEVLDAVPDGSNLGVGCGNPSALAAIKEGETVVDLGSGAGFDTFIVSSIIGPQGKVIGVDLSKEMLDLAKRNQKKGDYKNVEFIEGDIERLPLADHIANHVISNCVINLSLQKGEVYKEAYRILKKGGQMSISDIVLEEELPDFVRDSLAAHIACVSGAEKLDHYLQYIKDAGFKDIKVVSKSKFPLELMLTDPQVMKIAKEMNFDLDSAQAKDIASRVASISIIATK